MQSTSANNTDRENSDPAAWLLTVDGWFLIEGLLCDDVGLASPPEENLEQCKDVASVGAPSGVTVGAAVDEINIKMVGEQRQLWVRVGTKWTFVAVVPNTEITKSTLSAHIGVRL